MMNIIDRATKFRLTCDVGTRHFHCGHEYIEIGGIKWATMNIGANSVTDYGLYFQWGDTQGYTAEEVGSGSGQKAFTWNDYEWTEDGGQTFTKYNVTDGKTVLESSDDAVTAAWGGSWRMPTTAEFQALRNAVNTAWTEDYQGSSISGLVLTDKTDPSKVLFFPAAGYAFNGNVYNVGINSFYWSSSFNCECDAHYLYLSIYGTNRVGSLSRWFGFPMRGVVN